MPDHSLFPTFFISGFECSTFHWGEKGRRDLRRETAHDRKVEEDYALLNRLGIAVAREGVPWPLVDLGGGAYDFAQLDPFIAAMNHHKVVPIWDLCHYGYPDRLDPYSAEFAEAFAAYARAAAEYVVPRVHGPHYFTPINEITYFAFMGGEWGWIAPYRRSREDRRRLRRALCAADIAAVRAIREVCPEARMVHIEPLIHVVPPPDRPDLVEAAAKEDDEDMFWAWDTIEGRRHPELGGSPEILDIVGTNCYSFGQMEYREEGPHEPLEPGDPRIVPTAALLMKVWERYRRPMIIGETSGLHGGRPDWLRDIAEEGLACVAEGADLHAICLFPAVDMPDWHTGEWLKNGICDLVEVGGDLARQPFAPYVEELRTWQRRLHRVTELDEDPFDTPIDLSDIRDAARRHAKPPDQDWH